ncbi:MAG: tyrosine--tRNA ligase [Elusimicrobia bacterium]|nr:tyrosine--tRNA ligase [Elusimicrobiota bacterium]
MDLQAQLELCTRGATAVVNEAELKDKLASGRTLRVKLGVDPTSADLHLGHSVILSRLAAFQSLGHAAVLIIGDFTAMIGDPSGRDTTRPPLSVEQIRANAATYQEQAYKILDRSRTELRFNSEWLKPFLGEGLLDALKRVTVQQTLARDDFKARLAENSPLTMLETLYPVFQGQDSVAVKADVELGGNDQITNLLMGRRMQADAGQPSQAVLTLPLLLGTDGVKKMSKSYGNSIGISDPAREMFGKVMSVTDDVMYSFYELLTTEAMPGVRGLHPMEAKKALARLLVARFHGPEAADAEGAWFDETFSKRQIPADIKEVSLPAGLALSEVVLKAGAVKSRNEARRLIAQGGVKVDGEKAKEDGSLPGPGPFVLQVGKHQFVRVRLIQGGTS